MSRPVELPLELELLVPKVDVEVELVVVAVVVANAVVVVEFTLDDDVPLVVVEATPELPNCCNCG